MEATVSHSDGGARHGAQTLIYQPEVLSRGDLAALCRRAVAQTAGDPDPAAERETSCGDGDLCTQSLQSLGRLVAIGSVVPDFAHWRWYSRRPARWAARCILLLSRFLVSQQTQFNVISLNVLDNLAQQLSRIRLGQGASLRRVEFQLQERIDALESRVAELQRELDRIHALRVDP